MILRLGSIAWVCLSLLGCNGSKSESQSAHQTVESALETTEKVVDRQVERQTMVHSQIELRGVKDLRVLEAMRKIPRERYMPDAVDYLAYADQPTPIGYEQTISQPYIVARMTELLQVEPNHKVLEIGTGSGYQAAVLAEIGVELYTMEIVCELAEQAEKVLKSEGYTRAHVICGDGYKGWPEHAPFDRIIVTAAPPEVPQALLEQLKEGGIMVVPVGDENQDLQVIVKRNGKIDVEKVIPVRFVPMVRGSD